MVSNINMASELTREKPTQLHPSRVQLQTIIEEVMLLVGKSIQDRKDKVTTGPAGLGIRPKIQLINQIRSPLPLIEADEHRCTQLFYNLVANAVKFTHEGFTAKGQEIRPPGVRDALALIAEFLIATTLHCEISC
eukprot:s7328_g1.t1